MRKVPEYSYLKGLEFAKSALMKTGNQHAVRELDLYISEIKGIKHLSVRQLLKIGRENSGYSLRKVAEMTGMKIGKIFNAENDGGAYLRFDEMVALADIYQIELGDLASAVRYHEKIAN